MTLWVLDHDNTTSMTRHADKDPTILTLKYRTSYATPRLTLSIRHFFFAGEMLGPVLVSVHNIGFYQRLMSDLRRAIGAGSFDEFVRSDPRCRFGPSSGVIEMVRAEKSDESIQ